MPSPFKRKREAAPTPTQKANNSSTPKEPVDSVPQHQLPTTAQNQPPAKKTAYNKINKSEYPKKGILDERDKVPSSNKKSSTLNSKPSVENSIITESDSHPSKIKSENDPSKVLDTTIPPTKFIKNNPRPSASFIDEIINEANDLLQAAHESQCLGRLRASSTYLLLAHARLVGLGRRFDRSRCLDEEVAGRSTDSNSPESMTLTGADESSNSTIRNLPQTKNISTPLAPIILPPMPITQNVIPDVALMEHLARAGMELHFKRTGRGMQHDAQLEKKSTTLIPLVSKGKLAQTVTKGHTGNEDDNETPTKRKGGRGKKPPTLVMHTLLGAALDAKKLMRRNHT